MSDRPSIQELEDALRDTVDACGPQPVVVVDEEAPLTDDQVRELEARWHRAQREAAQRVADNAAADQVKDGTHLLAQDGTRYVVSNLQHRYVPVVKDPRARGRIEELLEVKTKTTLTLRHVHTREQRKQRAREEKRAGKALLRQARQGVPATRAVDWDRLDREQLGGDR